MPARKTIAEAAAARNRRRTRLVMAVIGAVPIVVLVVIGGVFLYQRGAELGPNELPSSIGGGEREDIQETVQAFFDGVNQYNPQTASETMLPLAEVGNTNMDRLILEVAALQAEQLTFQIQSIGATTLDEAAKQVSARVVTNYGPRDFVLTRRDGQWRVAQAPDLKAPQEAGPLKLSWDVTNSYWSDDGNTLFVVGNVKNTGSAPGYMFTFGAYVDDPTGLVLQTNRPPLPGSPFLDPGVESPFLLTFGQPAGTKLDPARVVIAPDFRPVPAGSAASFKKKLEARPARLLWQPGEMASTLANLENRDYPIAVFGYFRDASGRLLAVAIVGGGNVPAGAVQPIAFAPDRLVLPARLPAAVTGIATVDLVAVQTSN